MENLHHEMLRKLRKEQILGKAHVNDHRKLHHEVDKLESEVHSIKEHNHPYWEGKK